MIPIKEMRIQMHLSLDCFRSLVGAYTDELVRDSQAEGASSSPTLGVVFLTGDNEICNLSIL